ncbi:hypothetical protein Ahy_B01g052932 [Arachis hypogaea]|uniref:Small ribosomal subunit protein uS3 C-terminal domain-containing protein n=1 Tax=Arachis hypogaea TaxID=3818 RepID=A0A445AQQ4_ARAHY|nr:hypothetical protein Ahy_B01g052932 [Arachis hypogaea]
MNSRDKDSKKNLFDSSHNLYGISKSLSLCLSTSKQTLPYGHPNILAEFIAGQLRNRILFRKVMKKAIELTEQAGTKGIQVQIAGHIDGKEIARVEWIGECWQLFY